MISSEKQTIQHYVDTLLVKAATELEERVVEQIQPNFSSHNFILTYLIKEDKFQLIPETNIGWWFNLIKNKLELNLIPLFSISTFKIDGEMVTYVVDGEWVEVRILSQETKRKQIIEQIKLAMLSENSIEDWEIIVHEFSSTYSPRKTTLITTEDWLSRINNSLTYTDSYFIAEIDSDGKVQFQIQYFLSNSFSKIQQPIQRLVTTVPLLYFSLTYERLYKIPITKELLKSKLESKLKEMLLKGFCLKDYGLRMLDSTIQLDEDLKQNNWERRSNLETSYINRLLSKPVAETEFTKLLRKTYKEILGEELIVDNKFSTEKLKLKRNKTYKIITAVLDTEK